jgi:hypothetical protein
MASTGLALCGPGFVFAATRTPRKIIQKIPEQILTWPKNLSSYQVPNIDQKRGSRYGDNSSNGKRAAKRSRRGFRATLRQEQDEYA